MGNIDKKWILIIAIIVVILVVFGIVFAVANKKSNDAGSGSLGTAGVFSTGSNGTNCTPKTCYELGKICGWQWDGCSASINCGTCSNGTVCSSGQCIVSWCNDTDVTSQYSDGKNIYQNGIVSWAGSSSSGSGQQDLCSGTTQIYERYCQNNNGNYNLGTQIYTCQYGCNSGLRACNNASITGSIYSTSVPSGAYFYVDNAYKGVTPLTASNVFAGSRSVKFIKTGYQTYTATVTVTAGQTANVNATLTANPTGVIYATSVPSGAYFYVDNAYKGVTPLTVSNVAAGSRSVKFIKSGYNQYVTSATVTTGQTANVNATLTVASPTTGSIYATSVPSGAYFYVHYAFSGWVLKGTTPVNVTNMGAGAWNVKFTKTGYQDLTKTVTVTAGQTVSASATLVAS